MQNNLHVDPQLSPADEHLLPGSPAIDADRRGIAYLGAHPDIGFAERQ